MFNSILKALSLHNVLKCPKAAISHAFNHPLLKTLSTEKNMTALDVNVPTASNIMEPTSLNQVCCSQCGAPLTAPNRAALEADLLHVLEISPSRKEAPNVSVCKIALKARHGRARAKEIIKFLLVDRVVPATKQYNRRHLLFLNKQPLRLKQCDEEEASPILV